MKIEIGKQYSVSNAWKKSVDEIEHWVSEDRKQVICVETCWRAGTFLITPQNDEEVEELQHHYDNRESIEFGDILEITAFEEYEFDSTWDGVSEHLNFTGTHKWTEEEIENITEEYYEEFTSYLEETLDLCSEGCEVFIRGGIEVEVFEGY